MAGSPRASTSNSNNLRPSEQQRPSRAAAQEASKNLALPSQKAKRKPKTPETGSQQDQPSKKPKLTATATLRVLDYKPVVVPPSLKKGKSNSNHSNKANQKNTSKQSSKPDPSSLRLKSHPDAPGSKSKGAAAQTKTTTEPPATAEQPPPRPEGPRRPHLKPPPKLAKLDFTQCGDLSNAELLDRLALREFIVRYAALLYPPLLDIQRADQMRQRARRRSKLPTWLLDAADAPLNGFWRDPKATLSLLLAFLTVLENEMHDAKLSHGQPLLEGGKPSFLLFQAIVQGIDDLDLSQMEAHEVQKTSRYWLAAHHLLEDEGFRTKLPFRQSLATAEERQADSDAEEQSEAETEVDLEEGNENTKRLTLAAARPAADNSESDSEPSSSEDEKEEEEAEQGSEVSASLIDPHILQEDEAGSSSSSSSEAGDASGEEGPEEENDGSGRRSQRIRQLKHDEDAALKAQAHRALVASLRHRARRVTRATAGLSYDAADGEGHGDHEAQDIASRSASPKSQPRQQHNDDQKRRHPGRRLLNQFSPSRPITEAERVNVIQRFVELIVTRSEDFREAMQDGTERSRVAKQQIRKANSDFAAASKEHQKARPEEASELPRWQRLGGVLAAEHEERLALHYPESTLAMARFEWIEVLAYAVYLPTSLPAGARPQARPTQRATTPAAAAAADDDDDEDALSSGHAAAGHSLSGSILVHGPEPPPNWSGFTRSNTERPGNALLALPRHRMGLFHLSGPSEIGSFVEFLNGQSKLCAWERRCHAFERDLAREPSRASAAGALEEEGQKRPRGRPQVGSGAPEDADAAVDRKLKEIKGTLEAFIEYLEITQ